MKWDWNQGCGINLRDLHVRRGWCENVDSPDSICSSHEIQKELVFSSSPKLWKVTCRWGKNTSSLINPSCSTWQAGCKNSVFLVPLFVLLLCFFCLADELLYSGTSLKGLGLFPENVQVGFLHLWSDSNWFEIKNHKNWSISQVFCCCKAVPWEDHSGAKDGGELFRSAEANSCQPWAFGLCWTWLNRRTFSCHAITNWFLIKSGNIF